MVWANEMLSQNIMYSTLLGGKNTADFSREKYVGDETNLLRS